MKIPKVAKYAFVLLAFSGVFEVAEKYEAPRNLRRWVLEMHRAQIELLKMDWGNPGFSPLRDSHHAPDTQSCGKRSKLLKRKYIDEWP